MRAVNAVATAAWRLPRRALIGVVRAYRLLLSPWLGQSCRFYPTCSRYAIEALDRHGAVIGIGYAAWRVLRCNPWCEGGCDPVPDNAPWRRAWDRTQRSPRGAGVAGLFTGLLSTRDRDPGAATPVADDPTLSKNSP